MEPIEEERNETSRKRPFIKTAHEYADVATIHGIYYIFESGRYAVERFIWIIVVLLAFLFAIELSISAYDNWKSNPVLTSVGTTGHPIEKVKFPSITICPQGSATDIVNAALFRQFEEYLKSRNEDINDLSEDEIEEQRRKFLSETYPGALESPIEMIKMLGSPNLVPEKSLDAQTILNPEDEPACSKKLTTETIKSCPDGFLVMTNTTETDLPKPCWHFAGEEDLDLMDFEVARNYCQSLTDGGTSQLFNFLDRRDYDILWPVLRTGALSNGTLIYGGANNKIWSNIERDTNGIFIYAGQNLSEAYVTKENFEDDAENYDVGNMNRECATITSITTPSKFVLKARFCPNRKRVICRSDLIIETRELNEYSCVTTEKNSSSPSSLTTTAPTDLTTLNTSSGETDNSSLPCQSILEGDDTPIGIQKLGIIFNPCLATEKVRLEESSKLRYQKTFGSMDMQKSFKSLFELLWYSQLPCFDVANITSKVKDDISLIKRCYWKGKEISCASVFVTRSTDRGMCCTFNMEKANKIFKEGRYGEMVMSMQSKDKSGSYDIDQLPHIGTNEPSTQPGQDKGLMLVLDAHTDKVSSSSVSDNFRGFITVVDNKNDYPITERNGFLIRPGMENHVAISALEIMGEESIKSIDAKDRDCYFPDENSLEMHQKYSQSNCILECNLNFALNMMKLENETICIPWFYPIPDNKVSQFCDPWDTVIFQDFMSSTPEEECLSCLPDCSKTIYDASVSTAPFRQCDHTNLGASSLCDLNDIDMNPPIWSQSVQNEYREAKGNVPNYALPNNERMSNTRRYVNTKEKVDALVFSVQNNDTPVYDAYALDIAMVNFYFDKSTVLCYKRGQRMTEIDFISQMGGLLGLGLGCSFISIVEFLYWMTIRLLRNILSQNGTKVAPI